MVGEPTKKEEASNLFGMALTVADLVGDPSYLDDVADTVVEALNDRTDAGRPPLVVANVEWESASRDPVTSTSIPLGHMIVANATRIIGEYRHDLVPRLHSVYVGWCPGDTNGRGRWIYYTIEPKGSRSPSSFVCEEQREFLLGLGLPVHISSYRGNGHSRDRNWRRQEFLGLNAVVYDPSGNLVGRTACPDDLNEDGILIMASSGVMRLYKAQ